MRLRAWKVPLRVLVGDEVQVPLPVARLHVRKAVPLLRQGAHGLGQEGDLVSLQRDLAGTSEEERPLRAQEVAQVQVPDQFVLFAEDVPSEVDLDLA